MNARRALRLTLLVALVWVAVAAVQLALSYVHLRAGERAAAEVRTSVDTDTLRSGELRAGVEDAHDRFGRARRLLAGPVLAPARAIPYFGRQLRTAAAIAGAAEQAADAGRRPLAEARRLLAEVPDDDAARLEAVRRLARAVAAARAELETVELGSGEALLPPISGRRARLAGDLDELRRRVEQASAVTSGMADLLAGPRRYLLLAANNAEMRAGSGMFLSAGVVTFAKGSMSIATVEPTAELVLRADEAPPMTGDFAARWGWLEPNRDFRNLAVTPRFDVSAKLALRMWEARTGDRLDGVFAVDAAALAAVLGAAGAVTLDDDTVVEPDDAVDFVLHDQYDVFGTVGVIEQAHRRDALGRLATVAFERVAAGDVSLATLMKDLGKAAGGRHILAWARRPAEQGAWAAAGITGKLTEDSFAVTLLNRGGNKLDYFVRATCDVEAFPTAGVRELTVRVTIRNNVGPGEVKYVTGPHPDVDAAAGEYVGLLAVTLPSDARRSRFDGDLPLAVAGADGPTQVVATEVRIPAGETRELTFRTQLSAVRTRVLLEPSARLPPMTWRMNGKRFTDSTERHLVFD